MTYGNDIGVYRFTSSPLSAGAHESSKISRDLLPLRLLLRIVSNCAILFCRDVETTRDEGGGGRRSRGAGPLLWTANWWASRFCTLIPPLAAFSEDVGVTALGFGLGWAVRATFGLKVKDDLSFGFAAAFGVTPGNLRGRKTALFGVAPWCTKLWRVELRRETGAAEDSLCDLGVGVGLGDELSFRSSSELIFFVQVFDVEGLQEHFIIFQSGASPVFVIAASVGVDGVTHLAQN